MARKSLIPGRDFEVQHKPVQRSKKDISLMDPAELKRQLAPLAERLPPARPSLEPETPPAKLLTRENFAEEIGHLWRRAQDDFVIIGRRLNEAKEALEHGQFMAMLSADLPFSYAVANKLMKVSAAIDSRLLPVERLPPSYATLYEVLTLTPDERQQALQQNVLRPDMRRQDLVAFKRRLRSAGPSAGPSTERAALEVRERRLLIELEAVRARLAALSA